jgi:signal transduction histidine kinase
LKVKIKYTGIRILSEIMPRLLTIFYEIRKKELDRGYISNTIVESHGGRILAENNAGGKGSTFYLPFQ